MTVETENFDPLRLVREGTSQDQRQPAALKPGYVLPDERTPSRSIVFAQRYAALLKYYGPHNREAGDWAPFFAKDVSARLALVAIEDIESCKANLKSWFDYLNDRGNQGEEQQLKGKLGLLYSSLGMLAMQLDAFKEDLPPEIALKGTLQNLIRSQLAPAFKRLIGYYKGGLDRNLIETTASSTEVEILHNKLVNFGSILEKGLSQDWSDELGWNAYVSKIEKNVSVYGDAASLFVQVNHCATHNLFNSIFDQFMKVFARTVSEAGIELEKTMTRWNRHEPHYALFLAFLRLFEHARETGNKLTGKHLEFYYRNILHFREKGAERSHAHLLIELAKHANNHGLKVGELFKAGKDDAGKEVFFANDHDFVANQARVSSLMTLYRHGDEKVGSSGNINSGRIYASPVANSDDGRGAELTSTDLSWHPFYDKIYKGSALSEIRMPEAEIGFAIASHYLLMAEGKRTITIDFTLGSPLEGFEKDQASNVICLLSTEKGWHTADKVKFCTKPNSNKELILVVTLEGDAPAITPYSSKVHGLGIATNLPMLLLKLKHLKESPYIYSSIQKVKINGVKLEVKVEGLATLAVSNDFGPVDTSKPFQPFGALPVKGGAFIVGSKEVFQKNVVKASLEIDWLIQPAFYKITECKIDVEFLIKGKWDLSGLSRVNISKEDSVPLHSEKSKLPVCDAPDFGGDGNFTAGARHGFVRLKLSSEFGFDAYQADLINFLVTKQGKDNPGKAPVAPSIGSLSLTYTASTGLEFHLQASHEGSQDRHLHFYHLNPFGYAEQGLTPGTVFLVPQFAHGGVDSEAELYIGISGLKPPQNLSLLFQVVDGTANPAAIKPPRPHINWSYLNGNEWVAFAENDIQDGTGELLNSGIVTLAVPREAASNDTRCQQGQVWIRAAVHEKSDAICRLQLVAAQALRVSHAGLGSSSGFAATPMPAGTISKLDKPAAEIKSVSQPYPSFGGRGAEQPAAFRTRISERLRHKDRAITLWDCERLVLEAFPQVYKVKCLNHTRYEPKDQGNQAIYRELAPGHVTMIAIPDLQFQKQRDPLKPLTSLGLLKEIEAFVKKRTNCFAALHVWNPRFEGVKVSFGLRLFDGYDETYYSNLLKQTITRFLSPWAYTEGGGPAFQGKICKSALINFIEDQPYVDYVTDFKLFHIPDDSEPEKGIEKDEVTGSWAISILVSVSADEHEITIIKAAPGNTLGEACLCET